MISIKCKLMRLCSIDTSLNEEISDKKITGVINPEIAQVKFNIVKKRGPGLDRKTLEKSHILFITLPRKKISQEQYIELISYIDIGGCLILTLPPPPLTELGRFFEEFRKEIGISFKSEVVFGLPKIPLETRMIGSSLTITKAHIIEANSDPDFMKENGIKNYIPLALMDGEPVVLAANKRRGKYIILSTPEIFNPKNTDFLNRLLYLASRKEDFLLSSELDKVQIGKSNFSMKLQVGCLDTYLLSLYHYNFVFHQTIIDLSKMKDLPIRISSIISKQKVQSERPGLPEIEDAIDVFINGS